MLQTGAWIAIGVLALSHWLQVYKIHKHREVRDISIWTYVFLLVGYLALFSKAIVDWNDGTGDLSGIVKECRFAFALPVRRDARGLPLL
jgi:hypothetical protein